MICIRQKNKIKIKWKEKKYETTTQEEGEGDNNNDLNFKSTFYRFLFMPTLNKKKKIIDNNIVCYVQEETNYYLFKSKYV